MKVRLILTQLNGQLVSVKFQFHEGSINTLALRQAECLQKISIP